MHPRLVVASRAAPARAVAVAGTEGVLQLPPALHSTRTELGRDNDSRNQVEDSTPVPRWVAVSTRVHECGSAGAGARY